MRNIIETERLHLISSNEEMLNAIFAGDEAIGKLLGVNVASPWTEAGEPAFRFSLGKITEHPDEKIWWTYLTILKAENMLIGCSGYKGKPDEDGMVEFGYEVALHYRSRGIATEIAKALIENAFSHGEVNAVCVHTLAEENASVKVLRKCGLQFMGEIIDPEDGKLWKWEMRRNNRKTE